MQANTQFSRKHAEGGAAATAMGSSPATVTPVSEIARSLESQVDIRLDRSNRHVAFFHGHTILYEGDQATVFYRVVSGAVKISKSLTDGRRQVVDFASPGSFFGLTLDSTYTFTAEALTDVSLVRYTRTELTQILKEQPELGLTFATLASRDLEKAWMHITMLGRCSASERLAAFLLMVHDRFGKNRRETPLPMSRSDVADYLGLTTETISRLFTQFKAEGKISFKGARSFEVVDRIALEIEAEGESPSRLAA